MPGLSMSELGIVLFILLLVIGAGRLPRWAESLGSYLYRRGKGKGQDASGAPPPNREETPRSDPPRVS
jgi:Sec-independent protein translocase protein TatA